ncbi:hypothetical protein [Bacteroides sp. 51]|uniref:hypothetical protein n=1 Tax=Bacteroides sp. 51 TaxID=2302938 RepID=UPI0013D723E2|nr:hypothetical protein [Bacteroides sp. 51]NDV80784.1 hypothetical protein [Bacteroides sp. 51]
MRIKELRKKGADQVLKYFLQLQRGEIFAVMRWIEYTGWIIDESSPDIIVIRSPMGGQIRLVNAIQFDSKKECVFMKDKLNSEIVKESEPEHWFPTWVETYNRTHKDDPK